MENDNQTSKTVKLGISIAVMVACVFILLNQVKLNRKLDNMNKATQTVAINWDITENTSDEASANNSFLENMKENEAVTQTSNAVTQAESNNSADKLVVNKNSKKLHSPNCRSVSRISENNVEIINRSQLNDYLQQGYTPCSICNAGQ